MQEAQTLLARLLATHQALAILGDEIAWTRVYAAPQAVARLRERRKQLNAQARELETQLYEAYRAGRGTPSRPAGAALN